MADPSDQSRSSDGDTSHPFHDLYLGISLEAFGGALPIPTRRDACLPNSKLLANLKGGDNHPGLLQFSQCGRSYSSVKNGGFPVKAVTDESASFENQGGTKVRFFMICHFKIAVSDSRQATRPVIVPLDRRPMRYSAESSFDNEAGFCIVR